MRRILIMGLLIAGLLVGAAAWWLNQPLALSSETVDLSIEPGTSPRGVAQAAAEAGVDVDPTLLFWWFRLSGDARQIRAGSYELARGATPRTLLQMLVRGEESLRSVTLVEGWNWRQVRQALSRAETAQTRYRESFRRNDHEPAGAGGAFPRKGASSRTPIPMPRAPAI